MSVLDRSAGGCKSHLGVFEHDRPLVAGATLTLRTARRTKIFLADHFNYFLAERRFVFVLDAPLVMAAPRQFVTL